MLPDVPVQAPKKRNGLKIALSVVGGLVVLMGGCIAVVVKTTTTNYSEAKIPAEQFLTFIDHHDYMKAREMMSAETKSTTDLSQISDIVGLVEKRHGKLQSHNGPLGWRANTYNGVSTVSLSYKETCAHGTVNTDVVMLNEDGAWHVHGFHFAL